jgi:integrase
VGTIISKALLKSAEAKPQEKPFELWDTETRGFILRVQPSGVRSYIAQVARGRRVTIGQEGIFTPDEARQRCKKILGNVVHGREPLSGIDGADVTLLGDFVKDVYAPWLKATRPRNAANTLERIARHFSPWYVLPLDAITVDRIETWTTKRRQAGIADNTIARDIAALSGVLSRAAKRGKLKTSPMAQVEKPTIDRNAQVRFLDKAEEKRLRTALQERDAKKIAERVSGNEWREERKRAAKPVPAYYCDHLTPAVLVSLNTGLRRGELLALRWEDVDLKAALLTVQGTTSKNAQTRHVKLNSEACKVLKQWRAQTPNAERVFPVTTSMKKAWAALLTRAKVKDFRWHDLRHHFASRLVQASVPLNTVRDLLGHQSLTMTLRYAHLAPDNHSAAVEKLVQS